MVSSFFLLNGHIAALLLVNSEQAPRPVTLWISRGVDERAVIELNDLGLLVPALSVYFFS
jgi:hypothetical protein